MKKFYSRKFETFMSSDDIMEEYVSDLHAGKVSNKTFTDYLAEKLVEYKAIKREDAFDDDDDELYEIHSQIEDDIFKAIDRWISTCKLSIERVWDDKTGLHENVLNLADSVYECLRTCCKEEDEGT